MGLRNDSARVTLALARMLIAPDPSHYETLVKMAVDEIARPGMQPRRRVNNMAAGAGIGSANRRSQLPPQSHHTACFFFELPGRRHRLLIHTEAGQSSCSSGVLSVTSTGNDTIGQLSAPLIEEIGEFLQTAFGLDRSINI